jgi:hypothetical protein
MKPAGKQATQTGVSSAASAGSALHGLVAGGMRLTVTVTVVFTNANVVKVEDTINWFLLMKNRLSLE